MNIIRRELRAHRKALILWSVGMFLLVYSGMAKYSGYQKSGIKAINDLFGTLPAGLKAVMGVGKIDLTTAIGFYSILFLYIAVMVAIHATLLGAEIITKEERFRTAEFLNTLPVSRTKVITSKLIAAAIDVVILNLVTLASSLIFVTAYNKGESATGDILKIIVGLFFIQMIFLALGMAVAAIIKRNKLAAPVASGVMLFTFFLYLWLDITDKLPDLKYLTPFKYFDGKVIVKEGGLDPAFVLISICLIAVLLVVSYIFYQRRDLKI